MTSLGHPCKFQRLSRLVMVALWNRADHYIFALWFLLSFFLFSSPNLSDRRLDECLPYFHTWCSFSANLECMSEMFCTRLAEKCRTQKLPLLRRYRPTHLCDGAQMAIFGDFFASCVFSEPRAAGFRPASYVRTKATPCVEVWQTSNLRRLRLGE